VSDVSDMSTASLTPKPERNWMKAATRVLRLARTASVSAFCAALGVVACGTAQEGTTVQEQQALAASGGSGALSFPSDWTQGYCANVNLTNTGSATTTGWIATIALNQSTLQNLWNGTPSVSNGTLTVTNVSSNGGIAPSATTSFGFCGNATGTNYHPTLVSVTLVGSGGGTSGASGSGTATSGSTSGTGGSGTSAGSSTGTGTRTGTGTITGTGSGTGTGSATGTGTSTSPAACTWGTANNGDASFTWYYFGQGTAKGPNGQYLTACGYSGTESGMTDSVSNIANTGLAKSTYFAAIPGSNNFNTVNDCGACVEITNGSKKIIATIIDECPTDNGENPLCTQTGHLDLSHQAWQDLGYSTGDPNGTTWKFIACPVTGNIQALPKAGNTEQVYLQNTLLPITSVTVSGKAATHLSYGVWSLNGTNVAGATLTMTDVEGHVVTAKVPSAGGDLGVQFPSPGTCN
jgi:hypothetical protein